MSFKTTILSQNIDAQGREKQGFSNASLAKKLFFFANKKYRKYPYEAFASWYIYDSVQLFPNLAYTVCPFDTREIKSQLIGVYKDANNRFTVGKTGLWEVNVNWRVDLSNPLSTEPVSVELWIGKNGSTDTVNNPDFRNVDQINMKMNCIGVGGCVYYQGIAHLQGKKTFWLEKSSDYIQARLWHASTLDINIPDTHDGFIEFTYKGNKAE